MVIERGSFIKGQEYKVKYIGDARSATRTYTGEHRIYAENEAGEIYATGETVAKFEGRGGCKFYPYEDIESAIHVDPTKKKARKPVTCTRCFGAGRFEHVKHVEGGICFKCGGSGTT